MLNARESQKRLQAAHTLLLEPSTTREKFSSIRTLISGIDPRIDTALARCDEALSTIDKVQEGDVIMLSAERMPENTEEEKKRKKALLLFIKWWRELGSEVARVQNELQSQGNSSGQQTSMWAKIFGYAKGPLGIITVLAIGAATLQQTAVAITIENRGCATMHPSGSIPISIPGLSLPQEAIPSGGSAVATIPGLTVHVDGTKAGMVTLKVLSYTLGFQLPSDVSDVTLDGVSLLGNTTEIKLSESDSHTLRLACL